VTLERYFTQPSKELQPKKEAKLIVLEEWLNKNFRKKDTKNVYRGGLIAFLNSVYPNAEYNIHNVDEGLSAYFHEQRNFIEDFKAMIRWMENKYVPATIKVYANTLKKFFSRHGYKIDDEEWETISRSLLPAYVVTTQDEILTKEQLRAILNHLPIQHRALNLFLASTGCRIGETLQLKIDDLHLEEDPPSATIRAEYTKKGVGGRIVWMSYEAGDTIKEWLKIKSLKRKSAGYGDYSGDLVFPFGDTTVRIIWRRALKNTGLDKEDPKTLRSIYHTHTLRKFFRTQMGLARVPDLIVHAWMGHSAYLSKAYDRPKQELAKLYKEHMGAVSIYLQTVERETQQIVVSQNEVSEYLNKGWRFIAKLDDDQVIMEGKAGQIIPKEEPKEEVKEPEPKPKLLSEIQKERLTKSDVVTPIQVPSKPPISTIVQEKKAPEGYIYCEYWEDTIIRPEDCKRCMEQRALPECPKIMGIKKGDTSFIHSRLRGSNNGHVILGLQLFANEPSEFLLKNGYGALWRDDSLFGYD